MTQIASTAALADEAPATAPLPDVPDMAIGNADAPITMIEYASFTCPHCATFPRDGLQGAQEGLHRHRQGEVHLPRGLFRPLRPLGRDDGPLRRRDALFRDQRHAVRPAEGMGGNRRPGCGGREPQEDRPHRRAWTMPRSTPACRTPRWPRRWSRNTRKTRRPTRSKARPRSSSTARSTRNMSYEDLKAILDEKLG